MDFGKLGRKLAGDGELIRVYYYNAPVPSEPDPDRYRRQQRFLAQVQATPNVVVRLGRLEPRGETLVEKGLDVLIAVDMLMHAVRGNYEVAILVSGDGDLKEAVVAVSELGKIVKNACFAATPLGCTRKCQRCVHRADATIPTGLSARLEVWPKTGVAAARLRGEPTPYPELQVSSGLGGGWKPLAQGFWARGFALHRPCFLGGAEWADPMRSDCSDPR